MQLMGKYASANHDVIHKNIGEQLGLASVKVIENHHNFAWKERGLIVHRKGATPAQIGVSGIIPGTMNSPAYIVMGLGNYDSLESAAHGAGRAMSRTQAKANFTQEDMDVATVGIELLSATIDEGPFAYKDIEQVMSEQTDLVKTVGTFVPQIVKMA